MNIPLGWTAHAVPNLHKNIFSNNSAFPAVTLFPGLPERVVIGQMEERSAPGVHEPADHHCFEGEPVIHEHSLTLYHFLERPTKATDPLFI